MRDFIPAWLRVPRATTWLLLAAALLVAITLIAPAQLPVGVISASVGVPLFLMLLLRRRA